MLTKTSLLIALLGSCCIAPLHADTPASNAPTANASIPLQQTASDAAAWKNYLAKSKELRKADQAQLKAELKKLGQKTASLPEYTKEFGFEVKQ